MMDKLKLPAVASRKTIVLAALVLVAGIIVFAGLTQDASRVRARQACICNLQQIATATELWVHDRDDDTNDSPAWADLVGPGRYFLEMPVCPSGGSYSLSSVPTSPSCSIGLQHAIP
jgi:hypothetical protein